MPTEKKDWREGRKRRHLTTSASQYATAELCLRKWWLERVRRFERVEKDQHVFGTVLHAVCERYLRADDLGRDENGNEVDLYPEGWHTTKPRFPGDTRPNGTVTPDEQDKIKRLVAKAIENGVLERRPGRAIEAEFRQTVIRLECPKCGGDGDGQPGPCDLCNGDGKGTHFEIMGFIDAVYPDSIEDHKTTKSMRWAQSPDKLRGDLAMLTYAKQLIDANPELPAVTLRHNVFCKDDKDLRVRKTEATVTRDEIEKNWQHLIDLSIDMDRVRRTAEKWSDIPEPANLSAACNAYGGCQFMPICTGRENEQQYEYRLASHNHAGYTPATPLTVKGSNAMSANPFLSKLANRTTAPAPANGASVAPARIAPPIQGGVRPPVAAKVAVQPATPNQPVVGAATPSPTKTAEKAPPPMRPEGGEVPPWYVENCPACTASNGGQHKGFNSVGSPCRICDLNAPKNSQPTSAQFVIQPDGNGYFVWEARDGDTSQSGSQQTRTGAQPVKADAKEAKPAAATPAAPRPVGRPPKAVAPPVEPEPAPAADEPASEEQYEAPEQSEDTNKGGRTPGRPKKGFVLCVNAAVTKGSQKLGSGRGVIYLADAIHRIQTKLAADSGAASWYDLDVFPRRDALAKAVVEAAEGWGADIVVVQGVGTGASELKVALDAIRPLAGLEICGDIG